MSVGELTSGSITLERRFKLSLPSEVSTNMPVFSGFDPWHEMGWDVAQNRNCCRESELPKKIQQDWFELIRVYHHISYCHNLDTLHVIVPICAYMFTQIVLICLCTYACTYIRIHT